MTRGFARAAQIPSAPRPASAWNCPGRSGWCGTRAGTSLNPSGLLLAVSLGALLAAVPFAAYVPVWAVTTIAGIAAGIAASTVWLRSVTRRLGIGFRFTAAPVLD